MSTSTVSYLLEGKTATAVSSQGVKSTKRMDGGNTMTSYASDLRSSNPEAVTRARSALSSMAANTKGNPKGADAAHRILAQWANDKKKKK